MPFGVTTIEMTIEGIVKKGHIYPKKVSDGKNEKLHVGYPDDTKDILVVWGAGNKEGQYVDSQITGRMFMQIIHLKNHLAKKQSLTFKHTSYFSWEQQIWLTGATDDDILRMKEPIKSGDLKIILFHGKKVPLYYPRWFPPRPTAGQNLVYKEIPYPNITIEFREKNEIIVSPINIYLFNKQRKKKICSIDGNISHSKPHVEIFALIPDEKFL